ATVPANQRAALETLRQHIHAATPNLEECISYGVPAVHLDCKLLVAFGAGKKHCSFYPRRVPLFWLTRRSFRGMKPARETIRFPAARPLGTGLVRKLVMARVAERGTKTSKPKVRRQ